MLTPRTLCQRRNPEEAQLGARIHIFGAIPMPSRVSVQIEDFCGKSRNNTDPRVQRFAEIAYPAAALQEHSAT
jgi:hypothetical protein